MSLPNASDDEDYSGTNLELCLKFSHIKHDDDDERYICIPKVPIQ